MTLADVASVGAGPCAAGHLPAPQDPGARALWLRPQRAKPQLPQSTPNCHPHPHPRHVSRFLEGEG